MYNATITGERIKELRGKKSQDQCSKELGISRGALSFYENGERKPDAEILYKMCEYFSVSADYLLGITDTPSLNEDIQNACKVTGLKDKAVSMLSTLKYADRNRDLICSRIHIADYMLSTHSFWLLCYHISQTLNFKRQVEESIYDINTKKEIHINEEKRLDPGYSEIGDQSVFDYNSDIENEKEWFEFKKWELFKFLERFTNEMIDNYEDFIIKEAENNAKHNPTSE